MAQGSNKRSIETEKHATDVLWGAATDRTEQAESTAAESTPEESTATTSGIVVDTADEGLVVPFRGGETPGQPAEQATPDAPSTTDSATATVVVDEAAEAARVARNDAVIADALAHGRREEVHINDKWTSFKEYIPGTNGAIDDATIRSGYERQLPDGTTEVVTKYFRAHDIWSRGSVTSIRGLDGIETVIKVTPSEPGALDLKVGDTRSIPENLTTAAGLAPSTWDPKADGSLGSSRPTAPSSSPSSWSSDSSTPSTGQGSTGFGTTTADPGFDRHGAFTEPPGTSTDTDFGPGPGTDTTTDADRTAGTGGTVGSEPATSPIDDALGNLSEPAAAEPAAPSSRGGDAGTDGLSWQEPTTPSTDGTSSTDAHADFDPLDDSGDDATFQVWNTGTGGVLWRQNADGSQTPIDPHTFTEIDPTGGSAETGAGTSTSTSSDDTSSGDSSSGGAVKDNTSGTSGTTHPDDGTADPDGGNDDTQDDTNDSGDDGDEGYVVDDGYSSAGAIPVAPGGVVRDAIETAGGGHAEMTYSGVFGTFRGTLIHAETGNPHTVSGDYGNPTDETSSGPPTQDDAHVPTADPLIHVDPGDGAGADSDSVSLDLHEFQDSIHGGDVVDPNDPLFGNDTSIIQGDPHDTSPYEHGTDDMAGAHDASAFGDDPLD